MSDDSTADIPDHYDEQRALANELCDRADSPSKPDSIGGDEMRQLAVLVDAGLERDDIEMAVTAAEALWHLPKDPSLFEPVFGELIDISDTYPADFDGLPAPVDLHRSDEVRVIVHVAESLACVASDEPEIAVPHRDRLCEIVLSDRDTPRYHALTLGFATAVDSSGVPVEAVKSELKSVLTDNHGLWYRKQAAQALREIGDPGVLPALRRHRPDESEADNETDEAFQAAIDALEDVKERGEPTDEPDGALLAQLESIDAEPEAVGDAAESIERALVTDLRPIRVEALELIAETVSESNVERLPVRKAFDCLRADDEQVVAAAVGAAKEVMATDQTVVEDGVARIGFVVTRLDLDETAFDAADAIADLDAHVPDAVEALVDTLVGALDDSEQSPHVDSRPGAARALSVLAVDSRVPEYVAVRRTKIAAHGDDGNEQVRQDVVRALGRTLRTKFGTLPKVVDDTVRDALADDASEVRRTACEAIGEASTPIAFARLRELSTEDPDPSVRRAAEDTLSRFDWDESTLTAPDNVCETAQDDDDDSDNEREMAQDNDDDSERNEPAQEGRTEPPVERTAIDVAERIPDDAGAGTATECSYDDLVVGELLGEGGFAEVHEAQIEETDEQIALKRPKFSGTLTASTLEQFVDEAQMWGKLADDPHVVDLVDWGRAPEPWIAMEYMDGGDLRERLDGTDRPVDTPEGLWVATVLAETISEIHHLGIRHLDLKPRNVLFASTPDGTWDVPKIGDWGVARLQLEGDGDTDALSPRYAAPEQFDSVSGELDHRTDIYQLGAITYELLTGRPASEEGAVPSDPDVTGLPTPPTEVRPALPEAVDEPVLTALDPSKSDRFDRALYLHDGLERAFHEATVDESDPSLR